MAKKNTTSKAVKAKQVKEKKGQERKGKKERDISARSQTTLEGLADSMDEASLFWIQQSDQSERAEVDLIDYDKYELQTQKSLFDSLLLWAISDNI